MSSEGQTNRRAGRVHRFKCHNNTRNGSTKLQGYPAKLQKKQCGGVYFCVYGTAFSMPIQQKLSPPVLLFSDFAGWVGTPFRRKILFFHNIHFVRSYNDVTMMLCRVYSTLALKGLK